MSAPAHLARPPQPTQGRHLLWIGGLVFLLSYLSLNVVHDLFATMGIPMPDAADSEVVRYFASQRAAVLATGLCHLVSLVGLALFCWGIGRVAGPDRRRTLAGVVAIGALLASAVLSALATFVSSDAVPLLRDLSFYTGGVVHVVSLGLLVASVLWGRDTRPLMTRPVRVLGIIAASCAVLSVLSVAVYYASAFLPLGRVLAMIWLVSAGVSIARRHR